MVAKAKNPVVAIAVCGRERADVMTMDMVVSIGSSVCFLGASLLVLRAQHFNNKRMDLLNIKINLLERILFEGVGIPDHRNAAVRSLIARAKVEAAEL